MRKLILTVLLLSCALAGFLWVGLAIAANPPGAAPTAELPKTKTNEKDGAEMCLIPAGEFLMGTSEEELAAWLKAHPTDKREWFTDEMPQRSVDLDAYYMYKHPVTVSQFRRFTEAANYNYDWERWKPDWGWIDDHPMVRVTWDDAQAYAAWTGASLPTEAQWEKAARGGDRRVFPWGDAWPPPNGAGNFADMMGKRTYPNWTIIEGYDDGYANTSPVGAFAVNPYGLHDLAGNVLEWCADWYGNEYYKNAPARNPTGPATGTARVLRGGSWLISAPWNFRAPSRIINYPSYRHFYGFRCVLRLPGQ